MLGAVAFLKIVLVGYWAFNDPQHMNYPDARLSIYFVGIRMVVLIICAVTLFNWFWRKDLVLMMGFFFVHEATAYGISNSTSADTY